MDKLHNAKVCVVGAGGVGSHTVASLIRAGVGYIRVIDFDQVSLSSLNRHACATLAQVGTPKVTSLVQYAQQLCPDQRFLRIDARNEMYTAETGQRLLELPEGEQWDMIIDAIDDVPTKAQLVFDAWQLRVRCLSCMGAGGKADFTRLHVTDLASCSRDPLATKLRTILKKLIKSQGQNPNDFFQDVDRLGILFSSEKAVQKLADFTPEQKASDTALGDFGAVQGMRVRILPVLGTMPAIMGQALAAVCLAELAEQPFQPVPAERISKNVRHKLFQKLESREQKYLYQTMTDYNVTNEQDIERYKTQGGAMELINTDDDVNNAMTPDIVWIGPLQIDMDDVEYIMEVWKNRCSISAKRLGAVLELVRWDISKPASCNNIVLMSAPCKKEWDEHGRRPHYLPHDVRQRIENQLAKCLVDSKA